MNNLRNYQYLKRNKEIYKKIGLNRSVLRSLDSRVLKTCLPLNKTFNNSFKKTDNEISFKDRDLRQEWEENGFIKIPNHFTPKSIIRINKAIEDGLEKGQIHFNYTNRKIFNAYAEIPLLKDIVYDEDILAILEHIFGQPARLFQSINFIRGSEQKAHSDSIHMTTLPEGYLAGVWVALEPIHSGNGPLTYYPGSQKLPYITNSDYDNNSNSFLLDGKANEKYERKASELLQESQLPEEQLSANPGDVFIWHANLMHGGAPIKDKGTSRKSMVVHYFAENVLCFHEISERPAILK